MGTNKSNQRIFERCYLKTNCYLNILSEEDEISGFLIDLSLNGAAFEYIFGGDEITKAHFVKIIIEKDEFCIVNIPCRFIYEIEANTQDYDQVNWHRVGCWFGELTTTQKNRLVDLINLYCI